MSEALVFSRTDLKRSEIYQELLPQVASILSVEEDAIANMANFTAILKEGLGFFWIGFYLKKENELVLGPFQGPLACTRIPFHKGVCGAAFTQKKTLIVPDVDAFPGHIACSSASKSEIVIPISLSDGRYIGVLDIDSTLLSDFSELDQSYLEQMLVHLRPSLELFFDNEHSV